MQATAERRIVVGPGAGIGRLPLAVQTDDVRRTLPRGPICNRLLDAGRNLKVSQSGAFAQQWQNAGAQLAAKIRVGCGNIPDETTVHWRVWRPGRGPWWAQ